MAKKEKKTSGRSAGKPTPAPPSAQLLDMVEGFLSDHSFTDAHTAFRTQRDKKGWKKPSSKRGAQQPSLVDAFETWQNSLGGPNNKTETRNVAMTKAEGAVGGQAQKTNDSSSDGQDVDMKDVADESSSSSSSDSDSDDEADTKKKPLATLKKATLPKTGLKRKAPVDSSSSSSSSSSDSDSDSDASSSDSDSSSSSNGKPRAKKPRTVKSTASANSSSDSSESDSEAAAEITEAQSSSSAASSSSSSSSDSSSDSDSDSSSDSEDGADAEEAAKVPLPESDSDSSSSSSSDSDESESESRPQITKGSEESSVTLDKTSPEIQSSAFPPLPPDPTLSKAGERKKARKEAFSRIPKDIKVDPKFASNAYVPMDYSQRAFDDLVVTKGKGFTKEKNKKKRGSYRGGLIDISQTKGVYFDD